MVEGIVLAGGLSTRANDNKMLLKYKDKPMIEHVIDTMAPYVSTVFVVTGHYHDAITQALRHKANVKVVYNANYMDGMFSSVQTGVAFTMGDFFVIPGDIPLVHGKTYEKLLASEGDIRVPVHNGRKGHPLFIKNTLKNALLKEPRHSNLKQFRNQQTLKTVSVDDYGICVDVDTIEDFLALDSIEERNEKHED